MFFKHLTTFRIGAWHPTQEELMKQIFQPTTGSTRATQGWQSVTDDKMTLVIPGHTLLKFERETRSVPAAVVKRRVQEMAAAIERDTARKPGRREMKDLREQAEHELLAQAFGVRKACHVWIDHVRSLIHIDSTTGAMVDAIASLVVRTAPASAGLGAISTQMSPTAAMSSWLATNEAPHNFTIDRDCQIKGAGGQAITIKNMALDGEHVAASKHISDGKEVKKLAMTYTGQNCPVHFVLTDTGTITRLAFGDMEETAKYADAVEEMVGDFTIMSAMFSSLRYDITEALGGIVEDKAGKS